MSIQSNIEMMKVLYSDIDETILDEILKLIPIDLNVGYNEISKGQLALVRLALCISRKTPVYILDEPFDGLDIIVRRKVIEFLLSYVQFEMKTVVITSHQLEVIEPLIDEVYVIHEGRIQDQIDMQVLREEHNSSLSEYFEEKFKYLYERK
jgi:ABC-2 type transport system ATP-binding protein